MSSSVPVPEPFYISFDTTDVERMLRLVCQTELPEEPPFPTAGWNEGMDLEWLKLVKEQWIKTFAVDEFEAKLNRYPNFKARFEQEDVDLHFIHARTENLHNAVPLLLLHGWPGSFHDFHKVVGPFVDPPHGGHPSYHVVVPSLPGFGFSSYPRRTPFTFVEIGKLLHKLMTEVLGYDKYLLQGGDWGGFIARSMLADPVISSHIPVAHMNMFFTVPPAAKVAEALGNLIPSFVKAIPGFTALTSYLDDRVQNYLFKPEERRSIARSMQYRETGNGYVFLQSTKPLSIGYALNDSPIGLLTYIGSKFYEWSDPTVFQPQDLIETVALYYLTRSFYTSVMIYHQSRDVTWDMVGNSHKWKVANPDNKLGFSNFPYEIGAAPEALFKGLANLVMYKIHDVGGHFAALDEPTHFVFDIRELTRSNWPVRLSLWDQKERTTPRVGPDGQPISPEI
ncbi:alpha/beta-hydrolase [Exidia glandulosa HHB12029]|uniref:Alpha/beta-hydrolase n=1 Tax=Exidia glandulosa HHB12029 TaxID=1314781 RepID=A0A165C113_EXIGL|nr:alpha/beta-hydrolase [Exidia glandulosa HHB12029]